jgi:hypothetical protein
MKLLSISPSTKPDKKYMAKFQMDTGRTKTTHFGAKGMYDFTQLPHDEIKKAAYIARHRVNEDFSNPTSAGALSRWILWNKPSLSSSIADYRRKFNL